MHQDGNATNRNKNIHDFDITRYVFYYQESFLFFKRMRLLFSKKLSFFQTFFDHFNLIIKKKQRNKRNTRVSYRNDT